MKCRDIFTKEMRERVCIFPLSMGLLEETHMFACAMCHCAYKCAFLCGDMFLLCVYVCVYDVCAWCGCV